MRIGAAAADGGLGVVSREAAGAAGLAATGSALVVGAAGDAGRRDAGSSCDSMMKVAMSEVVG